MSKLSAADRRALPAKDFALGRGHYPIEDEGHAHAALSEVSQHGTPAEQATVKAKVHAKYPNMAIEGLKRAAGLR